MESLRGAGLLVVALALCAAGAYAGGGPENVAVVVNADSWASMAVANEFVALRQVPPTNVIYLSGISQFDHVPIDYFREQILIPVLSAIQKRGLAGQIDYVIYSADLPTKADAWADLTGAKPLDRMPHHCAQPWLSTTALTFLYPLTLSRNLAYVDLGANRYARAVQQERWDDVPWTDEQRAVLRETQQFFRERKKRAADRAKEKTEPTDADLQWEREGAADAAGKLTALAAAHPASSEVLYNLACAQAVTDQPAAAIRSLQAATTCGWYDYARMPTDNDLASLRDLPDFKALIETLQHKSFETFDSHGFRSSYGWGREGVVPDSPPAPHYLLSTALAVTSGRGNSVPEALDYLRRSAAADGTHPQGTVYFMRNGDIRSTTREWAFASAVAELETLGVKGKIVGGVLPQQAQDVAGLVAGSASFDWSASGSKLLPGALCEHLTSFGGIMEPWAGQTPITEWMRAGAAGTSGTVAEPFAIVNKFPNPFVQVHYARGCSLAEAFYQAVPGPYHLLILGDPLCQPWATPPALRVSGAQPGEVVTGQLSFTIAAGTDARPFDHLELFVDGTRQGTAQPGEALLLDTAGLCEGWHELRVVGIAAGPIETQSRVVIPIFVRSRARSFQVTAPSQAPWDQPLALTVSFPEAREVVVLHNQRLVGRLTGAGGTMQVNPRVLGMGRVQLHAVAINAAGQQVRAAPVEVRITPPAPWPASPAPAGKLQPGLRLQAGSQAPVLLEKLEVSTLDESGTKPFEQFQLDAWFEVPTDDTYQFQMRLSAGQATLRVDGKDLGASREGAWAYLPVSLQKGWHSVQIVGVPEPPVALEINFGGPGTYPLAGPAFQCLAP